MTIEALINRLNALDAGRSHRVVVTYTFEGPVRNGRVRAAEGRVRAYLEAVPIPPPKRGITRSLGDLSVRGNLVLEFHPAITTSWSEAKPVFDVLGGSDAEADRRGGEGAASTASAPVDSEPAG